MKYDFLIVGAGLFGSVFAHQARKAGKSCLVIDKRDHVGGNIYTQCREGIQIHQYGAHIFHTNNEAVWNFVQSFVPFNRFTNAPVANYKGQLYNLPFNMNTFYALWGVKTPAEALAKIEEQRTEMKGKTPQNLEEQAISLVGRDIYEKLIKGYTEKQWGRACTELPAFIIKRLPVRMTFDNAYFNDRFQGIPMGGYTLLIERMLEGTEVRLNTDFLEDKAFWETQAEKIVYTGELDKFFGYSLGTLEYRSLRFETEYLEIPNYQGNAVINYTERDIPYTRIIEHKHFEFGDQAGTFITREYPAEWQKGDEPYYPVNNEQNDTLFARYLEMAKAEKRYIFGGRLGEYKYYDMHQVVEKALQVAADALSK